MNLKELYQEIILEHGKNPRNLGKTENFNKDDLDKLNDGINNCKKIFDLK